MVQNLDSLQGTNLKMKKYTTYILIALATFTIANFSFAANWRLIFKTNNAEIYIDQSSISNTGAEKTVVIKSNEVQGERSPSSLELKYQVNCAANEVAVIGAKQFKGLDLQGDATAINTSNPPKFIEAKVGSAAGAFVKAACEQTKQDAGNTYKQNQNAQQVTSGDTSFKIVHISSLAKDQFAKLCNSNSPVSKNIINRIESNEREHAGAWFEKKLKTDFYITWSAPSNKCYLTVTPGYQSTALLPGNSSGRTHSLEVTQFAIYPDGKSFIYEAHYAN